MEETWRCSILSWHLPCSKERIQVWSKTIEHNHRLRHTPRSRKPLWWKLEKSYAIKFLRHLDFRHFFQEQNAGGVEFSQPTQPKTKYPIVRSRGMFHVLNNVDFVPSNVQSSYQEVLWYVFVGKEPVIKMIIKRRRPPMRNFSRTQRVAVDWIWKSIEQHLRTVRRNKDFYSKKVTQRWMLTKNGLLKRKSVEVMEVTTERLVNDQPPGLLHTAHGQIHLW